MADGFLNIFSCDQPRESSGSRFATLESVNPGLFQRPVVSGLLVFGVFLLFFLCFRTNNFNSVDGALGCLTVFHNGTYSFDGNNHLLYPIWIFLWSKLAGLFGITATSPAQFIRVSQAMNAFGAAASVGILHAFMVAAAGRPAAWLGTLIFGCSTALTLHATNSAQVIPGLFVSMVALGLLVVGLQRKSSLLLVIVGVIQALALASHQAMGVVAAIVAFLCALWPVAESIWPRTIGAVVKRFLFVGAGGISGVCLVYGLSYGAQGVPISQMPVQFLSLPDGDLWGGFSVAKVANLPIGLIRNLFLGIPVDYGGIRSLFSHSDRVFWLSIIFSGLAFLACILYLAAKGWWTMAGKYGRGWLIVAVVPCAALLFPPAFWEPLYEKLWLLPLAAASFLTVFSLRPGLLEARQHAILSTLLVVLVVIEFGINVPRVIKHHIDPTPGLPEVTRLEGIVQGSDWVVTDWDDVSLLWIALKGNTLNEILRFPQSPLAETKKWLSAARLACKEKNARILFVSILDQNHKTWDAFLGKRMGIPFEILDEYRNSATILDRYEIAGQTRTLRIYPSVNQGLSAKPPIMLDNLLPPDPNSTAEAAPLKSQGLGY